MISDQDRFSHRLIAASSIARLGAEIRRERPPLAVRHCWMQPSLPVLTTWRWVAALGPRPRLRTQVVLGAVTPVVKVRLTPLLQLARPTRRGTTRG